MPRGVHGSKRGRVPKSDVQRVKEGKKPQQGRVRDRKDTKANREMAAARANSATTATATSGKKKIRTRLMLLQPGISVNSPVAADTPELAAEIVVELRAPATISPAGLEVWSELATVMHHTGAHLKPSDARALATLCEDEALLSDAYLSIQEGAAALMKEAAEKGTEMKTLPLAFYMAYGDGRKMAMLLNTISGRVNAMRMQFGLTPASRLRLTGGSDLPKEDIDELEAELSA